MGVRRNHLLHWIGIISALVSFALVITDYVVATVNGIYAGKYVTISYTNDYGEHWFEFAFLIAAFVLFVGFVWKEIKEDTELKYLV